MALPTTTPTNLADFVLAELGDSDQTIWTQAEILTYVQRTLHDFMTRTLCLWKRYSLSDVAGQSTYVIPAAYNFHQMDRAEWDSWAVNPVPMRQLMAGNGRFETSGQQPLSYLMEGDGIATLRKIGVPTANDAASTASDFALAGLGADGGGLEPWGDPDRITADDDLYATADTSIQTNDLVASNFGLNALGGSIASLVVRLKFTNDTGSPAVVSLVRNAITIAQKSVVGSTDLGTPLAVDLTFTKTDWLVDLTGGDISDPTFAVHVFFTAGVVIFDYVKIQYWTPKFIIEFFAVGDDIAADAAIELPTRYMVHISHGAKSRAYKRDGDGQSLKMAAFWAARYEDGIEMVLRRKERLNRRRIGNIGNDGKVPESYRSRNPGSLPAYFPRVE